jgi:6-phosphofructokinase 1
VLGTERSAEFATPEGQRKAAGKLDEAGVEGLVIVGGNGSLTGGLRMAEVLAGLPE